MKIRLSDLKAKQSIRPEGYYDDVCSKGTIQGEMLVIDGKSYIELLRKYSPETPPPVKSCCGSKPDLKMPPLTTVVKNAAGAAARMATNVLKGNKIKATQEKIDERTAICKGCEFWAENKERCSICGCYTKIKISIDGESCPKGKW